MNRIALLPSCGDPFATAFYFHFFEKYWQDEVDKLYVQFNSTIEEEVVDFCRGLVTRNKKVVFDYASHPLSQGIALDRIFKVSDGEHIMFIEDDAVVLQHGIVDKYFKMIESGEYDVVGIPRNCCSPLLVEQIAKRFGLSDEEKEEKHGVNFWLCFFFCKRRDASRTDESFRVKTFKKGEYVKELDWTVPLDSESISNDAGVWFSVQMRSLGLKFKYAEQEESRGTDIDDYKNKVHLFAGPLEWLHIGSLSTPMNATYTDENDVPLALRKMPSAQPRRSPIEKATEADRLYYERKAGWITMIMERFWDDLEPIAEFRDLYGKAVGKFHQQKGLDMEAVAKRAVIYKELMKL